jgi:signal peptidase I
MDAHRSTLRLANPYKITVVTETTTPSVPTPAVETPKPQPSSISPRTVKLMSTWLRDLVIATGILGFVMVFLYQPVRVEGVSMLPSLDDQERIFISKFVYHIEAVSPGDVVVFRYPRDTSKSFIKRVIGVAGDTVRIDSGQVYVNDKAVVEDYVATGFGDDRSYPEITVPPHAYFLLGDHRNMSNDSRDFGPVNERFIYGKAVLGYWPVEKMGRVH